MAKADTPEEKSAAQAIARALREARTKAHLNQTELGRRVRAGRQTIGRYESGDHLPSREFVLLLENALGVDGLLASLLPTDEAEHHKLLRRYVHIEQTRASSLQQWQALVVPALLQTEEYAREVLAAAIPPLSPDEIDRFAASRIARQEALWRDRPLEAHFVIGESAVSQLVGGREVMRKQWQMLIEWQENPYITLQVLPREVGAHGSMQGSYTILEIEALEWAVYVETMIGGDVITHTQAVAHARRRFGGLTAHALSPRDSVKLLRELQQEEEKV